MLKKMEKRNQSRLLGVWLLLSMLFGVSIHSWAAKSDIVTEVTVSSTAETATFTITRSETSAATFVNYRTLDGSAVGGVHFEHQSGRLYFKKGEMSKEVVVKLLKPTGMFSYGNEEREFSLIAWNSFCDGVVATQKVGNAKGYNTNNTSERTMYLDDYFLWNDMQDVNHSFNVKSFLNSSERAYWEASGQTWTSNVWITFYTKRKDDGWYNGWMYLDGSQVHWFEYEDVGTGKRRQPWDWNITANVGSTVSVKWRSHGASRDDADVYDIIAHGYIYDKAAPTAKSLQCNTAYAYSTGDLLSVAVVYDEIVNFNNMPADPWIETNVGRLSYVSGAGTNVLYFQKVLDADFDATELTVSKTNITLKDIAGNTQNSISLKNTAFKYKASRLSEGALKSETDIWKKVANLTWPNKQTQSVAGVWHIYRYKTLDGPSIDEDFAYPLLNNELENTKASYEDNDANLLYDTDYTYLLQFVPSSFKISDLLLDRFVSCQAILERDFNIHLDRTNYDDHIELDWTSSDFKDTKAHEFKVYRRMGKVGSYSEIAKTNSTTKHYVDNDISSGCATYYYKVSTATLFADNNSPSGVEYFSDSITGKLSSESQVTSLEATKGTYANTVKLTWNAQQTGVDATNYKVYRRDLNADDGWVKLHSTSGTANVYSFDDNTALPGKYYEYKVASSYICAESGTETDPVEVKDDGFCRALGVVSGRVTYGTGTAVNGVKVAIVKGGDDDVTDQFYALRVNGAGSGIQLPLSLGDGAKYFEKPWTIQFYVNPDNTITDTTGAVAKNAPLVEVTRNFALSLSKAEGSDYVLNIAANEKGAWLSKPTTLKIAAKQFSHVTLGYDGAGSFSVKVTDEYGEIRSAVSAFDAIKFVSANDTVTTNSLNFGNSSNGKDLFLGYMDEIRVFSDKQLSDSEILKYYNHTLSGTEPNLVVYWPMDEGIKKQKSVYDYSKTSGVTNNNHGTILPGSAVTSAVIPTTDQLSVCAVTDEMGNYTINGIPFSGDGTAYMVVPSYGIHKFSPQYATRFVSSSSLVHSGVDFEDVSSFPARGIVYYYNTNYPVEGANIYVDGTLYSKDGELVTTDANGEFVISIPIGDHHIQVKKMNHVFVSEGRYPSNPLKEATFDRELTSPFVFYDSTFVTLTGRVAGGYPEETKAHGFGLGRANIGKATITLSAGDNYQFNTTNQPRFFSSPSAYVKSTASTGIYDNGNDARVITIHTDSATGEFAVSLPPVDFKVNSVKVDNNPKIDFATDNIDLIKFASGDLHVSSDSLPLANGDTLTFDYLYALDLIYRSKPIVEVTPLNNSAAAFGDEYYLYKDQVTSVVDSIPLFTKDTVGFVKEYTFGYPVFTQGEVYQHKFHIYESYENYDSAVVRTVQVPLEGASITVDNSLGAVVVAAEDGLDEDGNAVKEGDVVESDSKKLIADSLGYADYSFVATFPNIVAPYTLGMNINFDYKNETYAWDNNGKFAGIVTGTLTSGSNFVTLGPDKVLFVLRDPPGSGSSAYLEKGQTITTSSKMTNEYNSEYNALLKMKFGAKAEIGVGFGVIKFEELKSVFDVNTGTEISHDYSHTTENTYTLTTSERISTSDASNYVGEDGDIYMGTSTNLIMGKARMVAPVKQDGGYVFSMFEAFTVGEEFSTQFKYTQNYIENVLIPNFVTLRNSFLRKVSAAEYVATYPNNSDKTIFITTLDPEDEKFGQAGTYMRIKPGTGAASLDSVAYYNTQISLWETQIRLNEAAKVTAITSALQYDEKVYNDAVRKIEEAKLLENSSFELFDPFVQHYVKLDSTFWFKKQAGIKYSEYGSNAAMINNILEDYLITRSEYEKYLSTPRDERKFTLFYDKDSYGWKIKNLSFDSGTKIEESVQRCGSTASTDASTTKGLFVLGGTSGYTWDGFGFNLDLETKQGGTEAYEKTEQTENCTEVGFSLIEDGDDDALSVDVYQAPDGFGPIFYTCAGQTSCPYEDEKKTRYYEPGKYTLAKKTMQIEMPKLYVGENNSKAQKNIDVPSGTASNFSLKLNNLSEISEDVWYMMYVVDESNPNGAALSIDGVPFSTARQVLVNALQTTSKNLQIRQSRSDIMKYDSIAVVLASNCQYDGTDIYGVIADTVYLSVEFVPSCSPLTLQIDDRTMNSSTGDTLQLVVKDYEKDYLNFNEIRIQYKGERDNDWSLAQRLNVPELEGSRQVVSFPMSSVLFNDQTYQFRAISVCANGESDIVSNESETIALVKDMSRPQVLGNPNPSDGILNAGDEISVTYNEDIRNSMLSKSDNFIVQAVLNDAKVEHNVALKLDSTAQFAASTEADIVLGNKSFAVDMWVNLSSGGTLLNHASKSESFTMSVAPTGQLIVNVDGKQITSQKMIPFNKWNFVTLSYVEGEDSSKVSASVAYDAEQIPLFVDVKMPNYGATAPLNIGSNLRGAMGEMALWGAKRTNAESLSQMHFAKAASTENLIGYWKFDEGHGGVAKDLARNRHMALTTDSWYLNNVNYAAKLDGTNQLSVDITRCAALSSDDYMVEMWFQGLKQKNATLWSANTKVALKFNSLGYLTLVADSMETQLTTNDYLDGAWHHVAVNVLRNGVTSVIVDGTVVKQLASANVPALQASELTVGALRYRVSPAVYDYTNRFAGNVDELRYWVATFNAKAIDQFRYMRLTGDEAGLQAYYPFEDKTVDAGQTSQVFALKDMSSNHVGSAKGVATQATSAPALRQKPEMSTLNYSFVASERTVVITLNESASRLEGTTVNFTLKNVRDVNNNYSLPVTWSAYVSQNRLLWSDDAITLEKGDEEKAQYEVQIVNQGASSESWAITNLPSWLTASKTSGSLDPQKSEEIAFEVSDATPVGTYEEVIYLVGNEGIAVPFTLNLKVTVGKPDWHVDPSLYENSMSVIAQLKLDGQYSTDSEDLVAAFINGECVGLASPVYYPRYDAYFVSLDVYGNAKGGSKNITFKAWDASTGIIYPSLTPSASQLFIANKLSGSMTAPIILESNTLQEQPLALNQGWNWISLNVKPSDNSVNGVFGDVASSANVVKGKSSFSASDGQKFTGSLTTAGVGSMYKLNMDRADNLNVIGTAVDPATEKVTVNPGWNWIGFNSTVNMSLNDAFAGLSPVDGDMVKGQSGFALYQGFEWVGTLSSLTPGKGYMFKSVSPTVRSFSYPAKSAVLRSLVSKNVAPQTAYSPVSASTYSGNMTMVAMVKNGVDILDNVQVGIFDKAGVCRAAAATTEDSYAFLTILGETTGDSLFIKVIYNGEEYVLNQELTYTEDAIHGSLYDPYIIQLTPVNGLPTQLSTSVSIYPTLVENSMNVKCESAKVLNYSIIDYAGRVIEQTEVNSSEFSINASSLSQGIYVLQLETESGLLIKRFTKK